MLFCVFSFDKQNAGDVRAANRDAHLAYVKGLGTRVKALGPFLSEDGEAMIGSLYIVEAEARDAVEAIVAADPYVKADLFDRYEIHPWRHVAGQL